MVLHGTVLQSSSDYSVLHSSSDYSVLQSSSDKSVLQSSLTTIKWKVVRSVFPSDRITTMRNMPSDAPDTILEASTPVLGKIGFRFNSVSSFHSVPGSQDPRITGSQDPRIPGSQDPRVPGSQDPSSRQSTNSPRLASTVIA